MHKMMRLGVSCWFLLGVFLLSDAECEAQSSELIFFESERDGSNDIFVMNGDGSNQVNLTPGLSNDKDPAVSPDGSKIAFVSNADSPFSENLYVMDVDGSNWRRLTDSTIRNTRDPSWSPDGEEIVFVHHSSIELIRADGSQQRTIFPGNPFDVVGHPDWHPSGSRILIAHLNLPSSSRVRLYTIAPDGSDLTLIDIPDLPPLLTPQRARWSPRGDRILFDMEHDLYSVAADGSDLTNVTKTPVQPEIPEGGFEREGAWSSHGESVLYAGSYPTGTFRNSDIYRLPLDGGPRIQLTSHEGIDDSPVSWAPSRSFAPAIPTLGGLGSVVLLLVFAGLAIHQLTTR